MVTQIHFLLPTNPFCVCSSLPSQLSLLLQKVCVVIGISSAKATPSVCWVCKKHPSAAPPGVMPDQRMEPWVSSLCATLSQKGGLGVISTLLSLRAPWQHSHFDINTHQKRAQTHTQSRGLQRPGDRCRQGARTSRDPQDAKECQPRHFKVKDGTYQTQRPENSGTPSNAPTQTQMEIFHPSG